MIARYTRPEMGALWQPEVRFQKMLEVEMAVAEAQAERGLIPASAAAAIRSRGAFQVERILEIEKTTRHDVIAFVSNVAENVGPEGRFVHFGLTSSDVLDTALSLQLREAGAVLLKSLGQLEQSLRDQISKHAETLCAGRTHGMHAEPTSFGMKLAGHWAEMVRHRERLESALQQIAIGKLSGAVGTYSTSDADIEAAVCKRLQLTPETIATQVIPRDRHAELMFALASIGCGLERLAVELRHLQRSEVAEVTEGFQAGQKGSSAMPHKKNPISAENITGCARLLRSYGSAALEDVALWHERDISHSSVERVIFPDAFIICDYAVDRMQNLIAGLEVNKERMIENMALSQGQLFSSHLLLALVEAGQSREEAYANVQRLSHGLKPREALQDKVKQDAVVSKLLTHQQIDDVFSGRKHRESIVRELARRGLIETAKKG